MAFRIQNYDKYNPHANSEAIQKLSLHGFKASTTEYKKKLQLEYQSNLLVVKQGIKRIQTVNLSESLILS